MTKAQTHALTYMNITLNIYIYIYNFREREREMWIDVRNIDWLPAVRPLLGIQRCSLGRCPDGEGTGTSHLLGPLGAWEQSSSGPVPESL